MTKYKIGDKVRVRKDLKDGKVYRMEVSKVGDTFTNSMGWSRGKEVTIKEITAGGKYHIEGDVGYNYTDEMFECKVNDNKIVITTNGTETLARLYEGNKVIETATAKCSPDDTFNFETGAKIAFDRLIEDKPVAKWRVVNRPTKVGDFIRIKKTSFDFDKIGDILKVCEGGEFGCFVRNADLPHPEKGIEADYKWCYCDYHYEVVESIEPSEEKPKYYNGKVVCVEKDGDTFAYTVGKVYEFKNGRVVIDNYICHPYDKRITTLDEWNDDPNLYCKFIPFVE